MADLLWWLGDATETTAKVVVRSDTDGLITLTCNSASYTSTSASTTNDGVVTLTATGLVANTSYPITITHADASIDTGNIKTMPGIGSTFSVAVGSCAKENIRLMAGYHIADIDDVAAYVDLGDFMYSSAAGTWYGETTISSDSDQSESNLNTHYRQMYRNYGRKHKLERVPFYYSMDDHELFGVNWDHTLLNANGLGAGLANQAASDAAWVACTNALTSYQLGNPANNDAGVVAELPDYPLYNTTDGATPASNYPPRYFRFTIGDAEFFCLDCISHRSPEAAVDDANKTMLGSVQLAWLKARLDASTATFKVILTPKKTFNNAGADNGDTWNEWTTERDNLLDYIKANASGNLHGIAWIGGDRHTPSVEAQAQADGGTYDHVMVCACPISVEVNAAQGTHGATTKLLKPDWGQIYGVVRVVGSTKLVLEMRDSHQGFLRWSGEVLAGSNVLTYPDLQVAI